MKKELTDYILNRTIKITQEGMEKMVRAGIAGDTGEVEKVRLDSMTRLNELERLTDHFEL